METATVTLKKGEGRSLKAGGAWIYDNEIESVMGSFEDGDIVRVQDFDGYGLGKGFINRHSKIRVRMLTRNPAQEIDRDFLRRRVRDAWEYRKKTVDTASCRLIFGEADFLCAVLFGKLNFAGFSPCRSSAQISCGVHYDGTLSGFRVVSFELMKYAPVFDVVGSSKNRVAFRTPCHFIAGSGIGCDLLDSASVNACNPNACVIVSGHS